jgi:hypothetical protein
MFRIDMCITDSLFKLRLMRWSRLASKKKPPRFLRVIMVVARAVVSKKKPLKFLMVSYGY